MITVKDYILNSRFTAPCFVQGDSLKVLSTLPNNCIDCVVTSPPYYMKRQYLAGGIGLEATYDEYIENLLAITREIHRVLKPTGSFWLNIGDSYQNKQLLNIPHRVALSVEKVYFGNVDSTDSFFDSFRNSYTGFDRWFARKCDEEAYICRSDSNKILGFLYLKTEDVSENYSDIEPPFSPKRRLKVGTFKVESTGFRLVERFVKIIFDNA